MTKRPHVSAPPIAPEHAELVVPRRQPLSRFDELLTEKDVCERYPLLVGPMELRRARRNGEIDFVAGKKGVVFYHPEALAAYLERKEVKCQKTPEESSSNTAGTGSGGPTERPSSTPTAMTEEADRLLEDHLERKYSTKQRTG